MCLLWWLVAVISLSVDDTAAGVAGVLRQPTVSLQEGFYDGDCCQDFGLGLWVSFWTVMVGGLPMMALAFIARRLSQHTGRLRSSRLEPVLLAAFIFQVAAMTIGLVVGGLWLLLDPRDFAVNPIAWWLLATGIGSAIALPAWHALRRQVAPLPQFGGL